MALYAAARRAAVSSAPLLRAAALGEPRGSAPLRPLAATVAQPQPRAMLFSSVPATSPTSDTELLSVIDSEIKYAKDFYDYDRVEKIPENFPFKIIDEKGLNSITLTRTYQSEQIEVLVCMPSLVSGEEPYSDNDSETDYDSEWDSYQEDEDKPPQSSIPFTVTISRGDGPTLDFTCTAYTDEIIIHSLGVTQMPGEDEKDLRDYGGRAFNDLDAKLQRELWKYLALRGISLPTTDFLHKYMTNRDWREYLLWLMKMKEFFRQ